MKISSISIEGPKIVEPKVFGDHRGHFFESYHEQVFMEAGLPTNFVQDNQSLSNKGILRGLHFQAPPHEQGKLVRVIKGAVYDVIVDIRKQSKTFGQHHGIELNEENKTMFWIPPGFAHGFCTLEDETIFCYKCTGFYNLASENGIMWNDPSLNIKWPLTNPILSEKDKYYGTFTDFETPFGN